MVTDKCRLKRNKCVPFTCMWIKGIFDMKVSISQGDHLSLKSYSLSPALTDTCSPASKLPGSLCSQRRCWQPVDGGPGLWTALRMTGWALFEAVLQPQPHTSARGTGPVLVPGNNNGDTRCASKCVSSLTRPADTTDTPHGEPLPGLSVSPPLMKLF